MTAALTVAVLALAAPVAMAVAPNDPSFSLQWGDRNVGQAIPFQESEEKLGGPLSGTPGADDRAYEAWEVTTGSRSIVIGEADTGVDYKHADLAANIWANPGGVGGCQKGTHGFNVLEPLRGCEPLDEEPLGKTSYDGHGTHVAGIMGALGNNATGVAGLNWQTSILPVKWLSSANGSNSTEKLIEALKALVAAKQAGVNIRIVNDSPTFSGTPFSQALSNEIDVLGENNILFVTAAGNTGDNNDEESKRRYPCGYDRPNEICVTATDNKDQLPSWANFGKATVDLAAPGVSIYSTLREGNYNYLSGGSMAAAQVSGAAALILSARPTMNTAELKADILNNVDPLASLASKVRTGGRLNVAKAMPGAITGVTPNSGPAAGGTSVMITGANLSRATAVKFGSNNAATFKINSPTSITATSPAGAGTVDVTVTTSGGTSATGAGDHFTYIAETPPSPPGPTLSPGASTSAAPSTVVQGGAPGQSVVLGTTSGSSAIVLATSTAAVQRGRAAIKLRCVGSRACSSTLTLAVKLAIHQRGKPTRTRVQTIGRIGFSLRAGQTASVTVALSASGRARLSAARGRLDALLTILRPSTGSSGSQTKTVHLRAVTSSAKKPSSR
ncbi:MAG TPA: S8 family serine peptidase [Solirubrobacteraceae bacterium]|nr:S8 family serine peptidase [Solirubrobacteraceae bacterium]